MSKNKKDVYNSNNLVVQVKHRRGQKPKVTFGVLACGLLFSSAMMSVFAGCSENDAVPACSMEVSNPVSTSISQGVKTPEGEIRIEMYDISALHNTIEAIKAQYSTNGVLNENLASALIEVNKLNEELGTKEFVNIASIKSEVQKADEVVSKIDLGDSRIEVDNSAKATVTLTDLQTAVTKAVEKLGLSKYEVAVVDIIAENNLLCGKVGDVQEIKYQVFPTFLSNTKLDWTSSDDSLFTVVDDKLTYAKVGIGKVKAMDVSSGVSCLFDVVSLYNTDASAFGISLGDGGKKYLAIQKNATGYGYTFYDTSYKTLTEGQIDDLTISMANACLRALTDADLKGSDIEVLEFNDFIDKLQAVRAAATAASKPSAPKAGTSSAKSPNPAPASSDSSSDSSSASAPSKPVTGGISQPKQKGGSTGSHLLDSLKEANANPTHTNEPRANEPTRKLSKRELHDFYNQKDENGNYLWSKKYRDMY